MVMKHLIDIYEKLSVDNISMQSFADDFPIDGNLKVITKYLKDNGFKEVDPDRIINIMLGTFTRNFNNLKEKAFCVRTKDNAIWIRFGDTSSNLISEENPIFTIGKNKNNNYWRLFIEYMTPWDKELSTSEWLEKLNERFK